VRHPVRRPIIMALMLVGNAGLVTAIAALLGGFLGAGGRAALTRAALLVGSLAGLYLLARSQWVDRHLTSIIERLLSRFSQLDVRDYARLLRITEDYAVRELYVEEEDWVAERPLEELRLPDEGIVVLGVLRQDYLGTPTRRTVLKAGDTAIAYGHQDAFDSLWDRQRGPLGERQHADGVAASHARGEQEPPDA
jgi:hypothetical protein